MDAINTLIGEDPADRFRHTALLALPTVGLAAYCFMAHRPLLNTSLATAAAIGVPFGASVLESCDLDTVRPLLGLSFALTLWSSYKAVVESGLASRAGYGANLLASVAWMSYVGYKLFNK